LKGNFHEQFLGGLAGAIPPGYPARQYIAQLKEAYHAQGNPVVSIDTKKKS
jgi:hypothetical protein